MANCIKKMSDKLLSAKDAAQLQALYDANIEKGYSEKAAVQQAVKAFSEGVLIDRQEIARTADAFGVRIPARSVPAIENIAQRASAAATEPVGGLKIPEVTAENVSFVYWRLKDLSKSVFANEKVMAKRDRLLARMEKAQREGRIQDALPAINSEIQKIFSGLKPVDPQIGTHSQADTTGSLSKDLFRDNMWYNFALGNDHSSPESRNKFKESFQASRQSKKTNVLRTIHNLFARLAGAAGDAVRKALPELNNKQAPVLDKLTEFNNKFSSILVGTDTKPGILQLLTQDFIFKSNIEGYFKEGANFNSLGDPIGHLIQVDENGTRYLNQNLVSAMAMVAYNWLGTQGRTTLSNSEEEIGRILGYNEGDFIPYRSINEFKQAGLLRNAMAETLGAQAFKLLGLQLKKNADGKIQTRIEISLGEAIISTLIQAGLAEEVEKSADIMRQHINPDNINKEIDTDGKSKTNFIRITNVDHPDIKGHLAPTAEIQDMIDTLEGSDGVMSALFDIDSWQKGPSTTPITSVSQTLKGLPFIKTHTKMRKVVKALQDVQWGLKRNVHDVYTFLGRDAVLDIMGYNREVDKAHVSQRDAINDENRRIERSVEHIDNFVKNSEDPDAPLYFEHEVWKNNRIGMVSNTINPQADKAHRHIFGTRNSETKVTTRQQRDMFMAAVVQNLGGVIEGYSGIDKDSIEGIRTAFDTIMANDIIKSGIDALKNPSTEEHRTAIAEAVKLGGESMASLDGLVALAAYDANTPFDTNISIETDGITNGVIIGLMQTMLEKNLDKRLAAGGIFTDGINTDYGIWKKASPLNKDSYETLAEGWELTLNQMRTNDNISDSDLSFINNVLGTISTVEEHNGKKIRVISKVGRTLAKSPLMTTNYGSSINRILDLLGDTAIENFYSKLMEASNEKDSVAAINRIIDQFTAFTGVEIIPPKPDEVIEWELSSQDTAVLKEAVVRSSGAALRAALTDQFEGFTTVRTAINKAMKAMFIAFNIQYQKEVKDKEKAKGAPLTQEEKYEIYEALLQLMPGVRSAFGKDRSDGVVVMKTKKIRNYGPQGDGIQQRYSVPIGKSRVRSSVGTPSEVVPDEPGVAGTALIVQSLDSAVIGEVALDNDILNVFDAAMFPINQARSGTIGFNSAFRDVMENYSIMDEVLTSLEETMAAATVYGISDQVSAAIRNDKSFKSKDLQALVESIREIQREVADVRKTVEVTAYSQYSLFDSSFIPTTEGIPDNIDELLKEQIDKMGDDLYSNGNANIDFENFAATYTEMLMAQNSVRIFEDAAGMDNVPKDPAHQAELRNLLENLINKVISRMDETKAGFDVQINENGTAIYGGIKGNKVRIETTKLNVSNTSQISTQEALVHELIHGVTAYGLDNNPALRRQVRQIRDQVAKTVTWEDLLERDENGNVIVNTTLEEEQKAAQQRYEYIFNSPNSLHEFLAFGLTNRVFRKRLSEIVVKAPKASTGNSVIDFLTDIFNKILDFISGGISGLSGKQADAALVSLAEHLAGIHTRYNTGLLRYMDLISDYNSHLLTGLNKLVYAPIMQLFQKGPFPDKKYFQKKIRQFAELLDLTEKSMLVKLVREVAGQTEHNYHWHKLLRLSKKYIDQARKFQADRINQFLNDSFHTKLSKEEKKALTKAILKTDLSSLLDTYTVEQIEEFLSSPSKVKQRIAQIEAQLETTYGTNGNYYVNQANSLGHLMAIGEALIDDQLQNAYAIANIAAYTDVQATGDLILAEQLIDELATLRALDYTPAQWTGITANIMKRERKASATENGIDTTLFIHKGFKEKSLDILFRGNKMQMKKGYIHEIYNPNINLIITSSITPEVLKEMDIAGYKLVDTDPLKMDITLPHYLRGRNYMFVSKIHGLNTQVKTISSLTSRVHSGTDVHSMAYRKAEETGNKAGATSVVAIQEIKAAAGYRARQYQFKKGIKPDSKVSKLIPIINESGEIVNYRYNMSEATRDTTLERDNDFGAVLGGMEGSIIDKQNSKVINRDVIQLAYNDVLKYQAKNPSAFVEISRKSKDPRYKEIYDMMPAEMKQDIKEIFGGKPLIVREELVDLIFGYRKLSLADNKWVQKLSGTEAGRYIKLDKNLRLAGKIWGEVVGLAKDNIVIRSIVVLEQNILSNNVLLWTKGVPARNIFKDQAIALKEISEYHKQIIKRDNLADTLRTNPNLSQTRKNDITKKINNLDVEINQNPVKELIDAGIFQSIVEDININENKFGLKEQVAKKFEPYREKYIPKTVNEVLKQALFTRDTFIYQTLLKTTQYSDFIARYSLYKHLRSKGVAKEAAIIQAVETFVNYDVPTSPEMQWLNDIGFLMFTKFLFRIQKIIYRNFRDHPANALSINILEDVMNVNIPDITDSNLITTSLVGRMNNIFLDIPDDAAMIAGYEAADRLINF